MGFEEAASHHTRLLPFPGNSLPFLPPSYRGFRLTPEINQQVSDSVKFLIYEKVTEISLDTYRKSKNDGRLFGE